MKDFLILFVSIALGAVGQIAFKYGALELAKNTGTGLLDKLINLPIFAGLALYGVSTILWIMALRKIELSFAYPMISLGYIFVFIASYFLFNESLSWLRISGMLCILLGIVLIARS